MSSDFPPEEYPINIRFLAQGMLKVPKDKVPDDIKEWPREKVWQWALDYFDTMTKQELLEAVAYLDIEEDSIPDAVEVNDEDYEILTQSVAWDAFMSPDSRKMQSIAKST